MICNVSWSNGFITYSSGPGTDRLADMRDVVLRRAEHDLGLVASRHLAQLDDEFDARHHWHVPVEQDDIGHRLDAFLQAELAVFRLFDREIERFEDMSRDFADYPRIVDDQTGSHFRRP